VISKNYFSLIVTTIQPDFTDILRLFESLKYQKYSEFEVIFINQTGIEFERESSFNFNIIEIHQKRISLSKARNIGTKYSSGNILCYPDDDCYYHASTLLNVDKHFRQNDELDFVLGNHKDIDSDSSCNFHRYKKNNVISKKNITLSSSFTIFVKSSMFKHYKFDEEMGVGSIYGCGEEADFLIQGIRENRQGKFFPDIIIFHESYAINRKTSSSKAFKYALGNAHLYTKNKDILPLRQKLLALFIFPFGGLAISVFQFSYQKIRVRLSNCAGIIAYFIYYKKRSK